MDNHLNFETPEKWRDILEDTRRKIKRYQEYLNKKATAMADLRDRIIDIINNQIGEASINRELQEKYKTLYSRAGVAELNDELNSLIHITAVRTHLTNTVNYTHKLTASAKTPIQLNVAVKDQKRRGEQLFSPPKRLETDNINPQPQRCTRPARAHYKKYNTIHRKQKNAPYQIKNKHLALSWWKDNYRGNSPEASS